MSVPIQLIFPAIIQAIKGLSTRCVAWFYRVHFAANLTVAQLWEVKLPVNVVAEPPIVVRSEVDEEF